MLSYIVGLIAFLLFFLNPLLQMLWPSSSPYRTTRPQLNESLIAIDSPNQTAPECLPGSYSIHIFSHYPLVIYIENFLSVAERKHLLEIR
jgi:prolyl 4-hydroxylase